MGGSSKELDILARADVHITELEGFELWLDIRVHTVGLDLHVQQRELL